MIFRRIADRPIFAGLVGIHGILLSGRYLPHSQHPRTLQLHGILIALSLSESEVEDA